MYVCMYECVDVVILCICVLLLWLFLPGEFYFKGSTKFRKRGIIYECGLPPLHLASQRGAAVRVSSLLKTTYGGQATAVDRPWGALNWTPLMEAAAAGHVAVAELLLQHGANVNRRAVGEVPGARGSSPLHAAALLGQSAMTKLLLEWGADKEARMNDGATPLFVAALEGQYLVVMMLLSAGADRNAARIDGVTPLVIAAHQGHLTSVESLIDAGANVDCITKNGRLSAIDIARDRGHIEVTNALLEAYTSSPGGQCIYN